MAVALLSFTLSLRIIHRVRLFAQPLKMKTLVILANAAPACQKATQRCVTKRKVRFETTLPLGRFGNKSFK